MTPVDCARRVMLPDRFPGSTIYDYYIYSGPFGRITSQYKYDNGGIVHVENGGISPFLTSIVLITGGII